MTGREWTCFGSQTFKLKTQTKTCLFGHKRTFKRHLARHLAKHVHVVGSPVCVCWGLIVCMLAPEARLSPATVCPKVHAFESSRAFISWKQRCKVDSHPKLLSAALISLDSELHTKSVESLPP